VPLWFAVRIDLVSVATTVAIATFCVMYRTSSDPVLLAMLLSYSLLLQSQIISTVRMVMQVESRMANADRCFGLLQIPEEPMRGFLTLEALQRRNPGWPQHGQIEFANVSIK